MFIGIHQTADRLLCFKEPQTFLIILQKCCQFSCPGYSVRFSFFQCTFENINASGTFIEFSDIVKCRCHPVITAKPYHRKRDHPFLSIRDILQLFAHPINRMIIIRSKQNGLLVKKGCYQCIDDRIGFPGSRRSLDIGKRIFHRIMNGQKLIQIDLLI